MTMKNIFKISIFLFALQLISCSDDNGPSKKAVATKMLTTSAWGHAQVTHTDGDLSGQYTNFSILFTDAASTGFDGTYFISNGGNAFSETTGKWKFNKELNQIILDSEKVMDIELDETHLQLDFTTSAPGGKVTGLSGHFVFDLQPL